MREEIYEENPVSPGDGMPYYQGKPVTIIGEDWDVDYHVVMITITDYKTRRTYNKEVDYSSLEWH